MGHGLQVLAASRDLNELRKKMEAAPTKPAGHPPQWTSLARRVERHGLTAWSFEDQPESIAVKGPTDPPLEAWPGLECEDAHVNLRLFHTCESASRASIKGIQRLVELALEKDFAWLQKELRALVKLEPLTRGWIEPGAFQELAFGNLKRYLLPS